MADIIKVDVVRLNIYFQTTTIPPESVTDAYGQEIGSVRHTEGTQYRLHVDAGAPLDEAIDAVRRLP